MENYAVNALVGGVLWNRLQIRRDLHGPVFVRAPNLTVRSDHLRHDRLNGRCFLVRRPRHLLIWGGPEPFTGIRFGLFALRDQRSFSL
jgi:hypothetical protein